MLGRKRVIGLPVTLFLYLKGVENLRVNKSLYSRNIHVWLHELALSAISKNISKFEKQFRNILVLLLKS